MEHLKEVAIDAVIVLAVWFAVTAGSVLDRANKGLSCGGQATVTQKAP